MPRVPFDPATDYYKLLGVTSGASADEIQAAYRRLAKANHPDLNAGSSLAAERMSRLNVAKSVLLDQATRATYDQVRAARRGYARPTARATVRQNQGHERNQTQDQDQDGPTVRYAPVGVGVTASTRPRY